jgi:predicted nucleic acid-binding protein
VEPGAEGLTDPGRETVLYCDSSALVRAYLGDEPDHAALSRLLLDPRRLVATSSLTEVEIVAAIHAAARAGRLRGAGVAVDEAAADMGPDGPVLLLALDSPRVLPRARTLCEEYRLRALDAMHLAVALTGALDLAGEAGLLFVTRDADQAAAARAEGLQVA